MYEELVTLLFFVVIVGICVFCHIGQDKKTHEKVDGVESIDGITYLIIDASVNYVMYKLSSTCISRNIKEKKFEVVNDNEGILTFGGVNYSLNLRGSESDMDIGAAYRIKCTQCDNDVIMKVSFEKRDFKWFSPSTKQPGYELNQAYHRFFKEVLGVRVVENNESTHR